ncbi:putative methyltransferase NSUN6 isoform X1 [Apostichopus japonicus]|uniref:Putative methyltransferase NSUN6 isoform X1 n=1 Tax=Stichopus japonicus TaxID=307972 RepID=A0A2G8LQT4_STIJA|nr:putative methyltransferase NSUN6 isoform X1 [Apostichopus japonicus]
MKQRHITFSVFGNLRALFLLLSETHKSSPILCKTEVFVRRTMAASPGYDVPIISFKDERVVEHLFSEFFPAEIVEEKGEDISRQEFQKLLEQMSYPPVYSTLRVNTHTHDIDQIKGDVENKLEEAESDHRFEVKKHPVLIDTLIVKSLSMAGDDFQPRSKIEVIIDPYCGSAVLHGANIFGRGVIGLSKGASQGDQVSIYVDLAGKCRRGFKEQYQKEKAFIANGILETSRQELFEGHQNTSGVAVRIKETFISNPSLSGLLPKKVFAQKIPSITCSHVLNPQPGECVLDMCAAPGGKTTHIATLMGNEGLVVALEKAKNKVRIIKKNARTLNLKIIKAFHKNAVNAVAPGAPEPSAQGRPPYKSGSFDRVLLDAPCSGTGQRAQIRCVNQVGFVKSFPSYQRSLFHKAVEAVKPGGTIVYSTCSLTTSENEAIVVWALKTFPEIKLEEQTPRLGKPGIRCHGLTDDQANKLQRFWPSSSLASNIEANCDNDTIGFFIAKFVKDMPPPLATPPSGYTFLLLPPWLHPFPGYTLFLPSWLTSFLGYTLPWLL